MLARFRAFWPWPPYLNQGRAWMEELHGREVARDVRRARVAYWRRAPFAVRLDLARRHTAKGLSNG